MAFVCGCFLSVSAVSSSPQPLNSFSSTRSSFSFPHSYDVEKQTTLTVRTRPKSVPRLLISSRLDSRHLPTRLHLVSRISQLLPSRLFVCAFLLRLRSSLSFIPTTSPPPLWVSICFRFNLNPVCTHSCTCVCAGVCAVGLRRSALASFTAGDARINFPLSYGLNNFDPDTVSSFSGVGPTRGGFPGVDKPCRFFVVLLRGSVVPFRSICGMYSFPSLDVV